MKWGIEKLREVASALGGMTGTATHKVRTTADYVRGGQIGADTTEFVRKHAGKSLMAAAAVGFLIGRVLRGRG